MEKLSMLWIYDMNLWSDLNEGARLPWPVEGLLHLSTKAMNIERIFYLHYYLFFIQQRKFLFKVGKSVLPEKLSELCTSLLFQH